MRSQNYLISTITAVAIASAAPLMAENTSAAYNFLNIPTSSHVYGLGGTNIAIIEDDVSLADQNPALIGPELDKQIELNYMYYMGSSNFAGIRYGMGVGEHSGWAVGMRYLNYGEIDGYDEFGTPTGTFTPSDLIIEGTYARDITDRWRGGVNLKMAYSSYENYSAFAIAADLGVNYYDDEKDLSLSFVLKNMGGQVKRFDQKYCRVPFDIQIGYMQTVGSSPIQISITAYNLTRWHLPYYEYADDESERFKEEDGFISNFFRHLIFGVQYQASERFYACLAYNYKTHTDMNSHSNSFLSGFSLGAGFRVKGFSIGAAYAMPHKNASTLMLNLAYNVGELLK
ncbi:MAG: type IX secretion system protein PorQ [Candidatus Amulumruptor caecigallinarius]|nr:type IX secretion system protein PorQ [Candidatus Amulumruptor caecigallinarius]